jgi:Ca-activated chloride channel family protein
MKRLVLISSFVLSVLVGYAQSVEEKILTGNAYYRQGQFEMAEKVYREALSIDPSNTVALQNLGNALHRQKKSKEAIDTYNSVSANAQAGNVKAAAFYNSGAVYSRQKDLEASIEAYKNALRLKPDDKESRENLQKALMELKQKQQQQNQDQQKQPQSSSMSQKEAEKKLDELQEKEKKIQQRVQNQKGGTPQPNDW